MHTNIIYYIHSTTKSSSILWDAPVSQVSRSHLYFSEKETYIHEKETYTHGNEIYGT